MTATAPAPATTRLGRLYAVRGAVAVAWAAAFALAVSDVGARPGEGIGTGIGAVAMVLLIAYPAIDLVASVQDARRQPHDARVQRLNAVLDVVALGGLAYATTQDVPTVLRGFGAWAAVSGIVQLAVVVRRRRRFGAQWAMLVSGGLSTLAGLGFVAMASATSPTLTQLAGYAGFGGVLFGVSALLVRRHPTTA